MPVLVRNNESGPSVFSDPSNNVEIEWQGKDDKNGDDIQQIPDVVLDNVNFLRAMNRGIFTVVEASREVQDRLDSQVAAYKGRRNRAEQVGEDSIDRQSERTITTAVITETGKLVDGKAEEAVTPVVMGQREIGEK